MAQGLLDWELASAGAETMSGLGVLVLRLLRAAAGNVVRGRAANDVRELVTRVVEQPHPWTLRVDEPEGYVRDAAYPELYARAAEKLVAREAVTVIGIPTIGATLGAVVAEAAGARELYTVRPGRDPLRPGLRLSDAFERLVVRTDRTYALVDSPEQSVVSLRAVADFLAERGVARSNIVMIPNPVLDIDSARRIAVKSLPASAIDVGAGNWRRHVFASERDYPPIAAARERAKYLVDLGAGRGRWLYKFAGIGRYGEEKALRWRALAERGLVPRGEGFAHGFLRTEWVEGESAWPLSRPDLPREALVRAVASYLATVASLPSSPTRRGPGPRAWLAMTRRSAAALFGDSIAGALGSVETQHRRARELGASRMTDNKMQAWEWLIAKDGRILKCDAVDHAEGVDPVGPQDIAWDVAGAAFELELDEQEVMFVIDRVMRQPDQHALARKLPTYLLFYLGFRAGELARAARSAPPADRARLDVALARARRAFRNCIESGRPTRTAQTPIPGGISP